MVCDLPEDFTFISSTSKNYHFRLTACGYTEKQHLESFFFSFFLLFEACRTKFILFVYKNPE